MTPRLRWSTIPSSCKAGKEKELIKYVGGRKRGDFSCGKTFDYHWLKEDIQALYDDDRRVATVFTLFATISLFCLGIGIIRTFLIRHPPTLPRDSHPQSEWGTIEKSVFRSIPQVYMGDSRCSIIVTIPLSYYLIYIYSRYYK